jgi:hypothetical protein
MERGTESTLSSSLLCLEENALETEQKENELLLSIFSESTGRIAKYIRIRHCFLLINPEEILIKKNWQRRKTGKYTVA